MKGQFFNQAIILTVIPFIAQLAGCSPGESKIYTGAVTTIATGLSFPVGITASGSNLYVTNNGNHTVATLAASGVVSIAGSGTSGFANGTGTLASFNLPSGITTDGTYLYVADTNNHAIRKILITSAEVTTFAGAYPAATSGVDNGAGTAARFRAPVGIVWYGTNLYVADSGNNIIRMISASGDVSTFAGVGGIGSFANGASSVAGFNNPSGITTDGISLYVADTGNHAIRKIDISVSGVPVTTIAGPPPSTILSPGFADGTGTNARFNSPVGIVISGTNLYVADSGNHAIRQLEIVTGKVTTLAGSYPVPVSGSANGTGTEARFSSPKGITTDGINLYVTDTGNNSIRKIQ